VPDALPHIGRVNPNPVRDPSGAVHVLPLHAGRGGAVLLLPGLVQHPGGQPALPAAVPCAPASPATTNRRTTPIAPRCPGWHDSAAALRLVWRRVSAEPGDAPPVPLRQVAHHRRHVLPRLQPHLRPREARPQRLPDPSPFLQRRPDAYPDGSSRLRFITNKGTLNARVKDPQVRPPSGCRSRQAVKTTKFAEGPRTIPGTI
jgi:hypothetical protein